MVEIIALWLPILLSAVGVFIVSSLIHTVLNWHNGDYPKVPNEEKVMDAIRPLAIPPGDYMIPRPSSRQEMRSPEFDEKLKRGPVMMMTVWPNGPHKMVMSLVLWFVYSIIIGMFAACLAGYVLPAGSEFHHVFHYVGLTAFLGYSVALWQMTIWYRRPWGTTIRLTIDGLIYACVTGAIFGWLWPH